MGEQAFLCTIHCLDLIHIPLKLHEDISNGLLSVQECLEKINQRGITGKVGKREQSFFCVICRPDLIHIFL